MTATTKHRAVTNRHEPSSRLGREWADRLVGSDPGLNRLFKALEVVFSLGLGIGAQWLFVHGTRALLIPTHGPGMTAAQAAQAHAHNYVYLLIAMSVGGLISQLTAGAMNEPKVRHQLAIAPFVAIPTVAAIALGLAVNAYRVPSFVLLTAILGLGVYLRRFGARWSWAGITLFVGFVLGFTFRGVITFSGLGWVAAEVGLGMIVGVIVHLMFFYPRRRRALRITQRSYVARARRTARLALAAFDAQEAADGPIGRKLHRQLVRLNEAALMIDAQLVQPGVLDERSSAQRLHERLFDIELALTNVARFTEAMGRMDLPADQRALVRQALISVCEENLPEKRAAGQELLELVRAAGFTHDGAEDSDRLDIVIPHRFAGSVIRLADALGDWLEAGSQDASGGEETAFRPASHLHNGWLRGSAQASAQASAEAGPHFWDKIRMPTYTRAAIQMTVGIAAAIAAGDALSGTRFYWAVLAVFVSMSGTNNAGEQIRKALYRAVGTLVGVIVGIALAHAVGHHTNWTLTVILVATFLGFYLTRISYAYFVVGLVVSLSQVYVQLGTFSNSLLYTRLEETALGSAIGILAFTFVLPLRTRHVGRVAVRRQLQAMAALIGHATEQLVGGHRTAALRSDARILDDAHQALIASVGPLRQHPFGTLQRRAGNIVSLASAYRHHGRALVTDVEAAHIPTDAARRDLERACEHLNASIDDLVRAVDGPRDGAYVRSAALFDRVERELEAHVGGVHDGQLAVRDLTLIDETMAGLATALTIKVTDYDTARID